MGVQVKCLNLIHGILQAAVFPKNYKITSCNSGSANGIELFLKYLSNDCQYLWLQIYFLLLTCFQCALGYQPPAQKKNNNTTIVCIGVSNPLSETPPALSCQAPTPILKSANCLSPPFFRQFPPIYWFFSTPLKTYILL